MMDEQAHRDAANGQNHILSYDQTHRDAANGPKTRLANDQAHRNAAKEHTSSSRPLFECDGCSMLPPLYRAVRTCGLVRCAYMWHVMC